MTDRYDAEAKALAGCAPRRDPTQAAWDEWAQTVAAALSRAREAALEEAAGLADEMAADFAGGMSDPGKTLEGFAVMLRALASGEGKGRG